MKKIFFLFTLFLFANNVYAIELVPFSSTVTLATDSCTSNLLNQTFVSNAYPSGDPFSNNALINYTGYYTSYFSNIKPDTTYQIVGNFSPSNWYRIYEALSNSTRWQQLASASGTVNTSFHTSTSGTFLALVLRSSLPSDVSDINFYLCEGSCTSYEEYKTVCSEPTPESSSGSVYSSFINLYLDRYSFLATNFTSNPYLFAMIGIIFAFIVLELLLHLIHIKGGYKK